MINFEKFQNEFSLLEESSVDNKFLIAVSGGADSMVLLSLMRDFFSQKRCSAISVAHINYHLRGEDSNLDQKLVTDFCQEYDIPHFVYEVSCVDNKPNEGSIQLWARDLRYAFFREVMQNNNIDYLLTAHHRDDQLETFLINLSRGAGLAGLCGIPKYKNSIFRPMLGFTKQEIYQYAHENKIPFREDKSNKKNDYLRNKIRNTISPLLKDLSPHFLDNFQKSIDYINDCKSFINSELKFFFERNSEMKDNFVFIDKNALKKQNTYLIYEILKTFSFENSTEIDKILHAEVGNIFHSKEYQLLVDRQKYIISKKEHYSQEKNQDNIPLTIEKSSVENNTIILEGYHLQEAKIWFLDGDKINFPLKLRPKKEGEYFFPTGMQGKKKVSKFIKDEKISLLEKNKNIVLEDAIGTILGIVPFRQDRRKMGRDSINQFKIIIK